MADYKSPTGNLVGYWYIDIIVILRPVVREFVDLGCVFGIYFVEKTLNTPVGQAYFRHPN